MLPDPHSYFTDDELSELKTVYAAACRELGIDLSANHGPLRERVASLVMDFARAGECDSDVIRKRVIGQLNAPGNASHGPPQSLF